MLSGKNYLVTFRYETQEILLLSPHFSPRYVNFKFLHSTYTLFFNLVFVCALVRVCVPGCVFVRVCVPLYVCVCVRPCMYVC